MDALAEVLQAASTTEALFKAALAALRSDDPAEQQRATNEAKRLAGELPRGEVERLIKQAGKFARTC